MRLIREGDIDRISVGCLYILADRAVIDFPGSTRAAPSDYAVVSRSPGPLLREGDAVLFPFRVFWDIWEGAVVPTLNDPEVQIRIPSTGGRVQSNVILLSVGDYQTYIGRIKTILIANLKAMDYLPADYAGTVSPVTGTTTDDQTPVGTYPVLDVELTHPQYPPVQ